MWDFWEAYVNNLIVKSNIANTNIRLGIRRK